MRLLASINRILTLAEKEWTQIRRDLRSLLITLIIPSILIVLFGYALNMDVKNLSLGIYDMDRTPFSRSLIERFSHTEYFNITHTIKNEKDIDRMFDSGDITLALVIPRHFEKNFKTSRATSVQLLADGSDSTAATIAIGYAKAIVYQFNSDISFDHLKRIGITQLPVPVDIRTRTWYNPTLESKNFIVPGLIVVLLTVISSLIASLTISREWERGTMETLITTPVRKHEILVGKLIPYIFIGLFDVLLCISVGYFIFKVPFNGSFALFSALSVLFLIGTTLMGMLISSATRVQVLSIQIAMWLTYLPSFILSGYIFPIKNMPTALQGITFIIPARYMITIVNGIVLKGIGMTLIWTQVIFLLAFVMLVLVLSIKKMSVTLPEK